MAKIKVRPTRDDVPPHPIDGAIRPEGSEWTADQYTFRLIRDGDIEEVPPEGSGDPQAANAPAPEHPAPGAEPKADEDPGDKRKKPR
jgi:hypothetical protein